MKKRKRRLLISGLLFACALAVSIALPSEGSIAELAAFLAAYIFTAHKVLFKAVRNISYGKIFDENFLMAVASMGAFAIGEYPEAVAVMLFYQVGELFEDYAVGKSRKSIADLMNIRPDYANLKTADGMVTKVDPDRVNPGDIIVVRPGERVPLDGLVISGTSTVDTAALTGESVPRDVAEGGEILSGCINLSGLLEVRVTKEFGQSTVNRILELVENASSQKARTENFITRFAAFYTPVVVATAVALAAVPPLVIEGAVFSDWLYRALNFLVVSCPCALVISVPLGFFGGIGAASEKGVLVKGSNYLEAAARAEYVVMDKTGTLTRGVFEVERVMPCGDLSESEILRLAAVAESNSNHPISKSVLRAWERADTAYASPVASVSKNVEELPGHGVSAEVDGHKILAGNYRLMALKNIECADVSGSGTVVHVAADGKYAGYILISDRLKDDAAKAVKGLHDAGIKTVMLTGDRTAAAYETGAQLGIDRSMIFSELLPEDKVGKVEQLLEAKSAKGKVVFVGDGINDAPALARADVGIAMGALGSDAAIEAADIVIMNDEPSAIINLVRIAKKTLSIVRQNIVFALGVKLLVLVLSAAGFANMWAAVFADVGVSMIAIINSMRLLKTK